MAVFQIVVLYGGTRALKVEFLIELETKVAFQEDTIQQLNSVVCRQQEQIDFLLMKYQQMRAQLGEISCNEPFSPELNESPPHY